MVNEEWKKIDGYPRYEVSNMGRVRSYTSKRTPGKILKQMNIKGYQYVSLTEGEERTLNQAKRIAVHRLVAMAFIPNPTNRKHVDHIIPVSMGGKPTADNLRWVTAKENAANELTKLNRQRATEERKKKVYQYDENLTLIATYPSTAEAARELGKSQGNITSCTTGALPRYLGFIFSYVPLDNIEEREELERQKHYQFMKNRMSTYRALDKWVAKKTAEEGNNWKWYKRHPEESKQRSRDYYYRNREQILRKWKIKRDKEKLMNGQTT